MECEINEMGKKKMKFPWSCHEGMSMSGVIDPLSLNLGTRWWWVFSFTTWLFYAWGKSPGTHQMGE